MLCALHVGLWLGACDAEPSPADAGAVDAGGLAFDASPLDAAPVDASRVDLDAARPDAGVGLDAGGDGGATSSDAGPAGGDAGTFVAPACLGAARALTVSRALPYVSVRVGSASATPPGLFLLDLATTGSAIDLGAFTPQPSATGCDPGFYGERCTFDDLDFFGSWGAVTLVTQDHRGLGGVRQAGILGTDFLSYDVLTLDFDGREVRRTAAASLCADSTLRAAGLVPLDTEGFYSDTPTSLRPMRDVDSAAALGTRVPNVPTIPARLAGVAAVVQLDTGFDDSLVSHALNVNEALFDAIVAEDPSRLVRDEANDLSLSTCVVGVSEPVDAYTLAPGQTLALLETDGEVARAFPTVAVFVKRTPLAARSCGGIGTWTAPAAQLASSFFAELGVIVFDPRTARVWIRTPS